MAHPGEGLTHCPKCPKVEFHPSVHLGEAGQVGGMTGPGSYWPIWAYSRGWASGKYPKRGQFILSNNSKQKGLGQRGKVAQ